MRDAGTSQIWTFAAVFLLGLVRGGGIGGPCVNPLMGASWLWRHFG